MSMNLSFKFSRILAVVGWLSLVWVSSQLNAQEVDLTLEAAIKKQFQATDYSIESLSIPESPSAKKISISVPIEGRVQKIHLKRKSVRSENFEVRIHRSEGRLETSSSFPIRTYQGSVPSRPGTLAAGSILEQGFYATLLIQGEPSWHIRPLRLLSDEYPREAHIIFRAPQDQAIDCGVEDLGLDRDLDFSFEHSQQINGHRLKGLDGDGCEVHVAQLAYDSDYEFYDRDCEQDVETCIDIIETGLNITNLMYVRDVKITHEVTLINIRTDPETDFWAQFDDASNFGSMLSSFRSHWNDTMTEVTYDVAYYMTAKSRPNYLGLAYVGVVCSGSRYGMGVGDWGYEGVFRHELGHNWGASHSCGTERRFIMCGNSISSISAYNINVMGNHRDSRNCLHTVPHEEGDPQPPYARLDRVVLTEGEGPVEISVVEGDSDYNCDVLSLESFPSHSGFGAKLSRLNSTDEDSSADTILYSPRSNLVGTDYFRYTVSDGSGFEREGAVLVEIRPRSLIVYLPFEETEGDEAEDESGFGNDGELRGDFEFDTVSVEGQYGRGMKLSGDDDQYLSLGDDSDFDLQRQITVSVWFKVDGFENGNESLVAKGSSAWRLKRDGDRDALRFTCSGLNVGGDSGGHLRGNIPIGDGEWHHAVGVYDGSQISLYIDGELDVREPASGWIQKNSSSLRVGDDAFNGVIDEVRVYNSALSPEEVSALFNNSRVENLVPSPGSQNVIPNSVFSWLEAPQATQYSIYVNEDRSELEAADPGAGSLRGRVSRPEIALNLDPDRNYFLRIDPVIAEIPQRGEIVNFKTGFAYTTFSEPADGAASFQPGPGDEELGFTTVRRASGGDSPLTEVIDTSSTPTSPIFSHRSVEASTTFSEVSLEDRGSTFVSLILQARSTGYESEDHLSIQLTGPSTEEIFRLDGGSELSQRAGTGYLQLASLIPENWSQAQLVFDTSSNSGSASERYDFDQISFACIRPNRDIAFFDGAQAGAGETSWDAPEGGAGLSFSTEFTPTDGADSFAGIVEAGEQNSVYYMSHRSVDAQSTFGPATLSGADRFKVNVVLKIRDTGYESDDELSITLVDGIEELIIFEADGSSLEDLAGNEVVSFSSLIPENWNQASLRIESSTDSSAGSEQVDIIQVEFLAIDDSDPCIEEPTPTEGLFIRGDVNGDGKIELTDPISNLDYQFLGNFESTCLDALDFDDDGTISLSDPIGNLTYQFLGGIDAKLPGPGQCGVDTTPSNLAPCVRDAEQGCSE